MSAAPAAGGANIVLGAPIGSGGDPMAPGNPRNADGADGVTDANAEAVTGHAKSSSTTSDKRTLNGEGEEFGEGKDQALPLPRHMGQHDSARSSQDHVAELGEGRVSVRKGKEEFAALERRFSNMSQHSADLQRQSTRQSRRSFTGFAKPEKTTTRQSQQVVDSEKGGKTEEDEFNLADVLRSGREKSDQSGIKRKKVGVVWEDLEVVGGGGLKINIRNFLSAIIEQFLMPVLAILGWFGFKPFAPKPKTILHTSSGVLKPGEMCLVLGRPGSGCSTFLKSITNQREGYLHVNGDVTYAGVGWKEMHKLYAG
jgi:ABC-type multidrug transport system fused ATPase/permease subunit